jgi:hypothetical protein
MRKKGPHSLPSYKKKWRKQDGESKDDDRRRNGKGDEKMEL